MKQRCCDSPPPALPPLNIEALAQLAQALGHSARVSIVRLLLARESCVCGEIVDSLPLAQSTVSQHLKILKEAGWIQGEVDGPRVCYCINPAAVDRFQALIQILIGANHDPARTEKTAECKPRKAVHAHAARPKTRAPVVSRHRSRAR